MHKSIGIRLRIALLVAVVATAAVGVVGVATTRLVERSAEAGVRQLSEDNLVDGMVPETVSIPVTGSASGGVLVAPSNRILPASGAEALTIPDGDSVIVVAGGTAFGGVSAPVLGSTGPPQFVTAFTATGGLDQAVEALTRAFWIGGPILVVLLAIAAWFLAGRALKPVTSMVERTRTINTSSPHDRVPVPAGRNELSELAATMNDMLDRIEVGSDRQRRFISDASHELRTPLTALIGDVEIALAHPANAPWTETAERVLQQGERMEVLVRDLLEAATHAEAPTSTVGGSETIDLHELVQDEIDGLQGSLKPTVTISLASASGAVELAGDRAGLSSAIRNLLSNANRHAASSIRVAVRRDDHEQLTILVDDDGPGVHPNQRELIFDRFSRLDEARASDSGGSGLGLAIVKSIAERHHGDCWAERSPTGGARFVVQLPTDDLVEA